jgi:uncharacterized protein (DUF362 family)
MRKLNRREFLNMTTGAALTLGAGRLLGGCGSNGNGNPNGDGRTAVAAVSGDDLGVMSRQVLDTLGGIGKVVNPGETVFIKPNMVTLPFGHLYNACAIGECTKPEVLVAVTEACLEAGASQVTIGDGSQMPVFDWNYALYMDESTNLVQEVERLNTDYQGNVSLACVENATPNWVEVPTSDPMGVVAISSLATSADRVISIPVAKTHAWAHVTLALKNFLGITSLDRYANWIEEPGYWNRGLALDHSSPAAIAQIYLDVVAAVKPDLSIIDFSVGLEGNGPAIGPMGGKQVDMKERLGAWVLVASTDPVAADATTARIMSFDPNDIDQLTMARDMGLGVIHEGKIEVLGERIEDLQVNWEAAVLQNQKRSRAAHAPYRLCPAVFGKECSR